MASLGEYRVGIDFNPSGDKSVNEIKKAAAAFIDLCEDHRGAGAYEVDGEVGRLLSLAQTHMEDAAMWAVKAVTKKPRS
jgi:hypothetical protein